MGAHSGNWLPASPGVAKPLGIVLGPSPLPQRDEEGRAMVVAATSGL